MSNDELATNLAWWEQRAKRHADTPDESMPTTANTEHGWCHGIGELVTAMLRAGLVIEHLAEHDMLSIAARKPKS